MYDVHELGVALMLVAARLLVYTQLERASSMQQTDLSVNDLPLLLCQLHLNIYLDMDLNRDSSVPCTYTSTSTCHMYQYEF